jgi:hypothetical protein
MLFKNEAASLSQPLVAPEVPAEPIKRSDLSLQANLKEIEQECVLNPLLTCDEQTKGDDQPLAFTVCDQADVVQVVSSADLKIVESPPVICKSEEMLAIQVKEGEEVAVEAVNEKKLESFEEIQRTLISNLDKWKEEFEACPKPGNFFKKMFGMVANLFSATNIAVKVKAFRDDLEKATTFNELSVVVEGWYKSMYENISKAESVLSFEQVCKATEAIDLYEKNLKQLQERMKL